MCKHLRLLISYAIKKDNLEYAKKDSSDQILSNDKEDDRIDPTKNETDKI